MLHHQHTQVTVTDHQDQLLKLHAVLEQEHHGVQQLTLEKARQEPSREGGGAKEKPGEKIVCSQGQLPESNIPEVMKKLMK